MKYGNACKERYRGVTCNSDDRYCLKSYPYGDPDKYKSDQKGCRSVPDTYLDSSQLKKAKRECPLSKGICGTCCDEEDCFWSYRKDDADKGKGATAMCRCMKNDD